MQFAPYNRKGFLLPDSIHSMAAYHAKIYEDGNYRFRIHDCLTSIRLIGKLETEQDFLDAFNKATNLALALTEFAFYVERRRIEFMESQLPDCLYDRYCDQQTIHQTCKSKSGCNFQDPTKEPASNPDAAGRGNQDATRAAESVREPAVSESR